MRLKSLTTQTTLIIVAGLTLAYSVGLFLYSRDRLDALIHLSLGNTAQTFIQVTHIVSATKQNLRPEIVDNVIEPHFQASLSKAPLYSDESYRAPYDSVFRRHLRKGGQDNALKSAHVNFLERPLAGPTEIHRDTLSEVLLHTLRTVYGLPVHLIVRASVPLDDGNWLNMSFEIPELPVELWSPSLTTVGIMTITIILVSLMVVRRMLRPLNEFALAARRFASDIHAPPMTTNGAVEVRDVAAAFNEMQEQVRGLVRSRSEMMGAISHDVRTPLSLVKLRAESLPDSDEKSKLLDSVVQMERMVSATLGLAKQAFDVEDRQMIDAGALLQSISDDLAAVGGHISITPYNGRILVNGQPVALRRAFTNLAENGLRYGSSVAMFINRGRACVSIRIEDDGPGIPEDEIDRVFEPFYRCDHSRNDPVEGTGLGLSLAKTIIQNHGGTVELKNRKPNGLSAMITLPC